MIEHGAAGAEDDVLLSVEDEEWATASLLRAERPVPAPAFRGALGGRLARSPENDTGTAISPPASRAQVAAYLGGAILLATAALVLVGVDPFAG